MKAVREDRMGNPIGTGDYHVDYHIFDFEDYPQVRHMVEESTTSESVYVRYSNADNEKRITVRFSDHISNAVEFGDQLDGNFASRDEILYHLGLKSRKFIPLTYLSIWNRKVAKKEMANYEEAPLTIKEMYALGKDANLSEYKGKLAKGSNYLILGDKVQEEMKSKKDILGREVYFGNYVYED